MAVTTGDMLRTLVAFDTTSRDSNGPLIDFVEEFLTERGIASHRVWSEDRFKVNLWAAVGPDAPGGVLLSGHTDCVPVDGQPWTTDPFELTTQGDRLVGRGTSDMKSFIASALAAVDGWLEAGLARPIYLALSFDEETGGDGARLLVPAMAAAGIRPEYCVVGEPTSMQVVTSHKGIDTYVGTVTGTEAHSSLAPRAVNAIEYAAEMVVRLAQLARQRATDGPFDAAFDVPHTTVHTGTFQGGTALNIVPRVCEFEFEYRYMPEDSMEDLRASVEGIATDVTAMMPDIDDVGVVVRRRPSFPGLDTPVDDPVVAAVGRLTPVGGTGKVAYGTEAGLFADAIGPTVVCGPGSIDVAHRPDEYVEQAQLDICDDFMVALGESLR